MAELNKAALEAAWDTGVIHGVGSEVSGEANIQDLLDSMLNTQADTTAIALKMGTGYEGANAITQDSQVMIYLHDKKLIIQFNDGGTMRYKFLDLTGTGVTWQEATSTP